MESEEVEKKEWIHIQGRRYSGHRVGHEVKRGVCGQKGLKYISNIMRLEEKTWRSWREKIKKKKNDYSWSRVHLLNEIHYCL